MIVAVVVIAIVASGGLLANALRTQRDAGMELRQRFENVLTLRRTQALLVDAETGQRGFLLTAAPAFLEPYEHARQELPIDLSKLAATGVTARHGQLQRLSIAKLGELAQTIDLMRSGRKNDAMTIVSSGVGKHDMDAIRVETEALVAGQQRHIEAAIGRSEQLTARTYYSLSVLAAGVFALLWFGLTMVLRADRLAAEAERLRLVEQAERRTQLIARELNHRVKNLFAVVLAIVQLASRGAATPKDAVTRIRDRVQALARAHEISLGKDPMNGFDLETLLRSTLAPYALTDAELEIGGPPVQLPPMRVTPLGLIVHELATNAIKYGAWSGDGGKVVVHWSIANGSPGPDKRDDLLKLSWIERVNEPLLPQGPPGFGSRMIEAAVAQLDGRLVQERSAAGLIITIDAPIVPLQANGTQSSIGESP
jgi:two-component sensor histidine kinase